jgi:hypothetical protein
VGEMDEKLLQDVKIPFLDLWLVWLLYDPEEPVPREHNVVQVVMTIQSIAHREHDTDLVQVVAKDRDVHRTSCLKHVAVV